MPNDKYCSICSSRTNYALFLHDKFPYFNLPVLRSEKQKILKKYKPSQLISPLHINTCENCFHCYLDKLPDQEIINVLYSKYYSYPSPLKCRFHPERDDRFLRFFEESIPLLCKKNKLENILEVGCYDGYVLYHLQKKGFSVTGCDPSDGAEIGKQFGVNILKRFFKTEEFVEEKRSFDIVISRHFIEHVSNPDKWVRSLTKILKPGGLLIIETPNVLFSLEKGLMEVFSLQHLQGFTEDSLGYLLRKEGLKLVAMEKTPMSLIAVAEIGTAEIGTDDKSICIKNWKEIVKNYKKEIENKKNRLKNIVSAHARDNKIIGMWGAGGFGISAFMLYEIPAEHIQFIVDSDPNKWGMEYLNYSIPIISPAEAKEMDPGLILIASMYSESIKDNIEKMGFSSALLTLFPEISVTNSKAE